MLEEQGCYQEITAVTQVTQERAIAGIGRQTCLERASEKTRRPAGWVWWARAKDRGRLPDSDLDTSKEECSGDEGRMSGACWVEKLGPVSAVNL